MRRLKVSTDAADLAGTPVADYHKISGFSEANEVFRSRKFVQGSHYVARESIMRDTLIVLDGKEHLRRRNILNEIFSEAAVARLRSHHLVPVVQLCMSELAAMPLSDDGYIRTDLTLLSQRCVYRIAAAVAGIDGLDEPAAIDRMIHQIKSITAGFTVEWSKEQQDVVMARALQDQDDFRRELFETSEARRADAVERYRSGALTGDQLPHDVLTYTLLHKGDAWPDDAQLRLREMCLFLSAASQTTANGLLLFVLLLEDWLSAHPETGDWYSRTTRSFAKPCTSRCASPLRSRRACAPLPRMSP
ncbi:hypothetical protein L598_002600000210 [Mesorhizobium sp. J18]|uniref:cytochrome P450 n=1 Tax=Mesorhizobium sp. J18 TaxID=935263 RepID=UPI00119A5313|nr:cytochrome P450 [Mesorhizobium sp. J18]TWG96391.1 hypothetical protein L598_002600000210 [Mesorhizobium sp. J18]